MTIDFHYHVARTAVPRGGPMSMPRGCVLARRSSDNARYLEIATSNQIACGLFVHPRSPDLVRIAKLVSARRALAYLHMEIAETSDLHLLDPVLLASQEQDLPIILHLSRHDRQRYSERDANLCVEYILNKFCYLRVIVSHLGGENVLAVLETAKTCARMQLDTSCISETCERSSHRDPIGLLERIAADVSSKQLVFGSDQSWPIYSSETVEIKHLGKVFLGLELDDICIKNGGAILRAVGASTIQ